MPVHFITTPAADYLTGKTRVDGWSPFDRAAFLTELADCGIVSRAVETVGMGLSGLYALRKRDAVFAAAWDAARLLTRDRLRDTMIERAFEGEVHVTRKDGDETERRRRNYRLSLGMLDRLDQEVFSPLAHFCAGHFETVVSLIDRDADTAQWRGWLDTIGHDLPLATVRDLFPLPEESAENRSEFDIWEYSPDDYRTDLPPPDDFYGEEGGRFGEDYYERTLTVEEETRHRARLAALGREEDSRSAKLARGRAAWEAYFKDADGSEPPAPGNDDDAASAEADAAPDAEAGLGPIEVKSMGGLPRSALVELRPHRREALARNPVRPAAKAADQPAFLQPSEHRHGAIG